MPLICASCKRLIYTAHGDDTCSNVLGRILCKECGEREWKSMQMTKCKECGKYLNIAAGVAAYGTYTGYLCKDCHNKRSSGEAGIVTPEKVQFKSGATGTKVPHLEYIPYSTLVALANRFDLGMVNHGANAWNGYQNTQKYMEDKEWIIARLVHVIQHSYKQIAILLGQEDDGDDNAGAILFGGSVLAAYNEYNRSKAK